MNNSGVLLNQNAPLLKAHHGDWVLARFLVGRLKIKAWQAWLITLAITGVWLNLASLMTEGKFISEWQTAVWPLFVVPLVPTVYFWALSAISTMITDFQQKGPPFDQEAFSTYVRKLQSFTEHRTRCIIPLVVVFVWVWWAFLGHRPELIMNYSLLPIELLVVTLFLEFVFWYAFLQSIGIMVIVASRAVWKLIHDVKPEYDPFHPDGWAGFASIETFVFTGLYYLASAVIGVIAITAGVLNYIGNQGSFPFAAYMGSIYAGYIVIILGMMLPIWFVRNFFLMQKGKLVLLMRTTAKRPIGRDISTASDSVLAQAGLRRDAIAVMPEWPRQLQGLRNILIKLFFIILPLAGSFGLDYLIDN